MVAIISLICGGSFIFTAFQTGLSNHCQLVTFNLGARLIRTSCWDGYASVPHALTGGWAATLSFLAGLFIIAIGFGIEATRS